MRDITEKTSVPLFAVLGGVFTAASVVCGGLMWVGAIQSKVDVAYAKNIDQDLRFDRMSAFTQTALINQGAKLEEISSRTARTEAMVEMLVDRQKNR